MKRIAAFITPHGFGHATRTVAVLQAVQTRFPELHIELFTSVPEHIFRDSLQNFTLHSVAGDVGLIQHDALHNDIPATIRALNRLLPFSPEFIREICLQVTGCSAVLCDIAPLGLIVAAAAGIPSVLVENFTWNWIYQPFIGQHPDLDRHAQRLADIYKLADYHVQCIPVCNPIEADLCCSPIARKARTAAESVRQSLGTRRRKLILISLGGIDFTLPHWKQLEEKPDCLFVLAGQPESITLSDNCKTLSYDSGYFHPDLIQAADLVICKSGYSTVAECLQAGTPLVCIGRPTFAESAVLSQFIEHVMNGTLIDEARFLDGSWISLLPRILSQPRPLAANENGADQVADLLKKLISDEM